jgi:hypothetical protein
MGPRKKRLLGMGGRNELSVIQMLAQVQRKDLETVLVTPYAWLTYWEMISVWMATHYSIDHCPIALRPWCYETSAE